MNLHVNLSLASIAVSEVVYSHHCARYIGLSLIELIVAYPEVLIKLSFFLPGPDSFVRRIQQACSNCYVCVLPSFVTIN
jgi:hypothetical protein